MKIQHKRNSKKLCCSECDVGMRERPVCVDYVGAPLAANPDALEKSVDDVRDGE